MRLTLYDLEQRKKYYNEMADIAKSYGQIADAVKYRDKAKEIEKYITDNLVKVTVER